MTEISVVTALPRVSHILGGTDQEPHLPAERISQSRTIVTDVPNTLAGLQAQRAPACRQVGELNSACPRYFIGPAAGGMPVSQSGKRRTSMVRLKQPTSP